MKRYRIAVCKGPDCKRGGSDEVFAAAKEAIVQEGLESRCTAYRGGCFGLCEFGPNVVQRDDTGKKPEPFSREDFQLMDWPGELHHEAMTPEKIRALIAALKD